MAAAKPILVATPATLAAITDPAPLADTVIIDTAAHIPSIELLSIIARAKQVVVIAHRKTVTSDGLQRLIALLPSVKITDRPVRRAPKLNAFLESEGYGSVPCDVAREGYQGEVAYHFVPDANGVPVINSGLVESSQQEIDEVVSIIRKRAAGFTIVPASYVLTVVALTHTFRIRLGAELKSLANKDKAMGMFLRHVRIVDIVDVAGAHATDAILAMCYAKTSHGRLLQQFGALESDGGRGMLLDALAVPTVISTSSRPSHPTIWTTSDCIRMVRRRSKPCCVGPNSLMTAWSARRSRSLERTCSSTISPRGSANAA